MVSVPLRGLGNQKLELDEEGNVINLEDVSVPLRGLGNQKHLVKMGQKYYFCVSVPLRGLGNQKLNELSKSISI